MINETKANFIKKDILLNHLPRIKEGLEKNYVDENQILVVYDHAVRARILDEYDKRISAIIGFPEMNPIDALKQLQLLLQEKGFLAGYDNVATIADSICEAARQLEDKLENNI